MKKILYLLLATLFVFSSCKIGNGEKTSNRTIYGYNLIASQTYIFVDAQKYVFDLFNLDAYINAKTEEERSDILRLYFRNKKIVLDKNNFVIYSENAILLEGYTDNNPLTQNGSVWHIEPNYYTSYLSYESLVITNVNGKYLAQSEGFPDVTFRQIPSATGQYFSFTTEKFFNKFYCTDLSFSQGEIYTNGPREEFNLKTLSGSARITNGNEYGTVECTYKNSPFSATVTYRGVTEVYNDFHYDLFN